MRIAVAMILAVLLFGCTITSDGAYEQLRGSPIDYEKVDQLNEHQSTRAQTVAALGPPTEVTTASDGTEVIEYVSVKRRESVNRTFGISHGRSQQTMEERVRLFFKDGLLIRKSKMSNIY